MAPASTVSCSTDSVQKQYFVVHEKLEHCKVVGTYSTEAEAFSEALRKQVDVLKAIKEQVLEQVLQKFPDQSLAWKLRMLQNAMEAFFVDVGFEALTDFFTVTDQPATESAPNKRKMFLCIRAEAKMAKVSSSCGVASTTTVHSMSRYMYQSLPFGTS